MKGVHLAWLAAFCGLMRPGSALVTGVPGVANPFLDEYVDPTFERHALQVDGLLPDELQRSIAIIKKVRDDLRDAELPSPFWDYEQALLAILDELWYELRAAVRESQVEVVVLDKAGAEAAAAAAAAASSAQAVHQETAASAAPVQAGRQQSSSKRGRRSAHHKGAGHLEIEDSLETLGIPDLELNMRKRNIFRLV